MKGANKAGKETGRQGNRQAGSQGNSQADSLSGPARVRLGAFGEQVEEHRVAAENLLKGFRKPFQKVSEGFRSKPFERV